MPVTLTCDAHASDDRTQDTVQRPDRRLLAGYLHKTSNTLCGIKGYASLIAERGDAADDAGHWARKIIREVERMEEIFHSVGDLSRQRRDPDIGVHLPGFISRTVKACMEDLSCLELELGPVPEGDLKLPTADLALLLREILTNSAESAAGETGIVKLEIGGRVDPDGQIFLEIRDDGCGMDAHLSAQATRPFVTTKEGRHGVGLTRVDTLMDMYGLRWSLESLEGVGTRVLLEIAETV